MTEISQQVFEILTKRKYSRGEPYIIDGIVSRIDQNIKNNEPIKLVGFWGVGPKEKANWADKASCEFFNQLNNEIKTIYYPGIELVFIFAVEHGLHNGYDKKNISSYINDIKELFAINGFKYIFLQSLWEKYEISFEKIEKIYQEKPVGWWNKIENREIIERNAENRNKRLVARIGAQKYFIMRGLEKEMLEKEFPDSIFFAFSDPELKNVLPNMPTLYYYSREGWSDAPWFVIDPKE